MRPMRLRKYSSKAIYWVLAILGSLALSSLGLLISQAAASAISVVLSFAVVVVAARTFRGPVESDAPRPWWKMSYGTPVGWIFGSLELLSAIVAAIMPSAAGSDARWGSVLVSALVGVMLLHSSYRLRRNERAAAA